MPEVQRSFYTTGKVGIDYFHYVADELPAICGKWFHLDQRRENTLIIRNLEKLLKVMVMVMFIWKDQGIMSGLIGIK